ncbi:flagellar hook-associated protein FlgK [Halomonas urumqiensis]|uniref:Flagellar hook-associated protein 1 n=1 Tax=Halomonas urumqiensis TaxID=1684789 RepID=A0A2N7UNQ5_9GAMM|nr:flagellar hook-associated protein FlgK [Halomonas urumqiensis]PMR82074.1 flagellar hook-associated protein FlgK [Halomonas urumqiensis]PTB02594.1 flagellar hook-associated protein FlgK [Halomonas urumqiensis]GHE21075.1 flagellar hook-associated protein 1 [Halomonas urumqiensis]
MSIFSIGVSGLNAAQNALATTSNNISNVYTPGYNRELVILGEGAGSGGVQVNDIQRQFNQFVAEQLNSATSSSSALATYQGQVSQIDNLLADRDAGLAPLMQNFFSSLEDLASAPSDPAARQGLLGTADTLTAQFRAFDGYLQDMQRGINGQISDEVTQINNATEQLATLNREITLARARTGEAPNGLQNQRDQLVSELSERMNVTLDVQDGKTYNISLPNGQPLVSGTNHYRLEAMDSPADPQRTVLGYRDSSGGLVALPENTVDGGTLGGLMQFRAETLDKTQNQIGQLAVSLATRFNEVHREGTDLNGDPGQDVFSIGEPRAYSDERNPSGAEIASATLDTDNLAALSATDYSIRFNGAGEPEITRKDSGQRLAAAEFDWDPAARTLDVGGVSLEFDIAPSEGDRFEIQPVRRAAADMRSEISDLDQIAAGTSAGSGDNTNALALQELQNEGMVGGKATLNQAYAGMVSDVGNRSNIVKVNLDARQGLTDQLEAVQQSESGVNLDEEAANLLRYQQFYSANARVIDTASTVFDTILGLRN